MKKPAPLDTAAIARADKFNATIFLGTGRYRSESFGSLSEAREAADRFAKEANNGRLGMVYASTPEGRSIFVPASYQPPMNEGTETMIKTKPTAALSSQQIAQLTAMITGGGYKRAASKEAALKRFENVAAERGIATDRIIGAATFDQAKSVLAHSLKTSPAKATDTPAAAGQPVAKISVEQALGNDPLGIKAARVGGKAGKVAAIKGEPKDQPAKPAKAAKQAEKPAGKRAAILEAAQRGEMPAAPDFSAETHKRFRPTLEKLIELAKAGDIAGLKAVKINPISSSPKAMDKYRNLAVIALEAQAAAKKAA
ncbi:hypothetical protein [Mesorhizobium sp. M2A.F.Ca.ET.039.01.1.1]|uniref:hypothetical protein n=1 Tax=Mesorhizobium sp. M2A.F.Ca.ET.039.01.1.1 TaxID=2496746 RepID=UPI000FCBB7A7|nr:hypothetical protein [Mesorhizobium sp. M2A.F.Ca.ET.039.01.1.1]RWX72579.1 hypothetical protein EOA24_00885 [Mesorhizobium sp. M2A.F.Ca.ET.039.01.1.1]